MPEFVVGRDGGKARMLTCSIFAHEMLTGTIVAPRHEFPSQLQVRRLYFGHSQRRFDLMR